MTEYGKHGKPRSRLSTLPTLLGNPFRITTFPRPRLLAYFKLQEHGDPNTSPPALKGVVMEVLGPKCNGRSGTLTPLRSFCFYGSECDSEGRWSRKKTCASETTHIDRRISPGLKSRIKSQVRTSFNMVLKSLAW